MKIFLLIMTASGPLPIATFDDMDTCRSAMRYQMIVDDLLEKPRREYVCVGRPD